MEDKEDNTVRQFNKALESAKDLPPGFVNIAKRRAAEQLENFTDNEIIEEYRHRTIQMCTRKKARLEELKAKWEILKEEYKDDIANQLLNEIRDEYTGG